MTADDRAMQLRLIKGVQLGLIKGVRLGQIERCPIRGALFAGGETVIQFGGVADFHYTVLDRWSSYGSAQVWANLRRRQVCAIVVV